MIFGSTLLYWVKVKHLPSGETVLRRIDHVNPQTMLIIDPDGSFPKLAAPWLKT